MGLLYKFVIVNMEVLIARRWEVHDNGYTQKEMLNLILDGKQKINDRIDELHEKVNQKISRAEISGWLVAISALVVLIQAVM